MWRCFTEGFNSKAVRMEEGGWGEWRQWEEGKADGAWCVPELAATSQGDGANCSAMWDGRAVWDHPASQQFREEDEWRTYLLVPSVSSFSLVTLYTPKVYFLLHIWAVGPSLLKQLLQKPHPTACWEHWPSWSSHSDMFSGESCSHSEGAMRAGSDRKAEDSNRDQGSFLS